MIGIFVAIIHCFDEISTYSYFKVSWNTFCATVQNDTLVPALILIDGVDLDVCREGSLQQTHLGSERCDYTDRFGAYAKLHTKKMLSLVYAIQFFYIYFIVSSLVSSVYRLHGQISRCTDDRWLKTYFARSKIPLFVNCAIFKFLIKQIYPRCVVLVLLYQFFSTVIGGLPL